MPKLISQIYLLAHYIPLYFPGGSDGKASAYNAGDQGSIPGLGRSSGEGNGNPLQYPHLENPTDRGAWQDTVHGIAQSWTQMKRLNTHTHSFLNTRKVPFPS